MTDDSLEPGRFAEDLPDGWVRASYPVSEAKKLLDEHEAVVLPDGVVLTRTDRLPSVTGGEIPLHAADQLGAFLRDNHRPAPTSRI